MSDSITFCEHLITFYERGLVMAFKNRDRKFFRNVKLLARINLSRDHYLFLSSLVRFDLYGS